MKSLHLICHWEVLLMYLSKQIGGHAAILVLLINTILACTRLIGHFLSSSLDKTV